ncbi:MAG: beta-ketoacyl-[acyl-carrier-protein] synthase family protein [Candidatus Thiodiazotropha sp. LLP2]
MLDKYPRRVAITGYGAVCSLGNDVDEIWNAIINYKVGYKSVKYNDSNIVSRFFGKMEDKPSMKERGFSKSITKFLPEFAKLGMYAASEAVNMAFNQEGELEDTYTPFERGVIFGTGWGSLDEATVEIKNFHDMGMASPFSNLIVMPNVATAAMSMHWNLRGYQNTPIAACATGSIAIGDAFEIIRSGRAKMMIAGGGESIREDFCVWSIDALRALSKEQEALEKACCPFSQDRSGFVLSEGAAVLCLEDMDSAQERGARILGEITGYGNYSDARDITSPAEDLLARKETISTAINRAGLAPEDIDYINTHGTSTPLNDLNETQALKLALGNHAYKVPMSSAKSYTGHLVGGAGSIESIFCLKTIETGIMPATIHLNNPDPECDLDFIPNVHKQKDDIQRIMNVNYGFGGSNSALLFESPN